MVEKLLKEAFLGEPALFQVSRFAAYTYMIREIARAQLVLDPHFRTQLFTLRRKLYLGKLGSAKFWDQYKKSLIKSVSKNSKKLKQLIKQLDKEMKKRIKEEEKHEEKGKPLIDLRLPE